MWRITPIGDSITEDTCGPQLLSQMLIQAGRTNFVFVGTETNNQSCNGAPTVESEGHAGFCVSDLIPGLQHYSVANDSGSEYLPAWAANDKSDVLLMQFGTNDAWNSVATQTILEGYSLVLSDYRATNPNVIMFVAQITPLYPDPSKYSCPNCEANVVALNSAIPGWATSQSTTSSPVYVVDLFDQFNPPSDYTVANGKWTADGVHPNLTAAQLIATAWYNAIVAQGIP
ncbi:MAG: GDSL-type esterase/lipase family protein [Polyangiaceae bacterium]